MTHFWVLHLFFNVVMYALLLFVFPLNLSLVHSPLPCRQGMPLSRMYLLFKWHDFTMCFSLVINFIRLGVRKNALQLHIHNWDMVIQLDPLHTHRCAPYIIMILRLVPTPYHDLLLLTILNPYGSINLPLWESVVVH